MPQAGAMDAIALCLAWCNAYNQPQIEVTCEARIGQS
jgi:hypothetical protein